MPQRHFLPQDFSATHWANIQPFYEQLLTRPLPSLAALRQWFLDRDELEGALAEDAGWRYIRMTCDTTDETHRTQYEAYVKDILTQTVPLSHELNKKALQSPHAQALQQEAGYDILLRCMANSLRIFHPDNVPLLTQVKLKAQEYGQLTGAMTVQLKGETLTPQQAAVHLESPDRAWRQTVYTHIGQRRLQDQDTLHDVYTALIQDRHQMALNTGFDNFRDYAFVSLNRFDYTPQDCYTFHQAVEDQVVPLLTAQAQERQAMLSVDTLRPWDHQVDPTGQPPLRPFRDTEELLQKTITTFERLDPLLGDCLRTMQKKGHFDLDSRKGKAPGGYNYPLNETGIPFIFMNATTTFRDMVVLMHEGGHAIHSFLMQDLPLHGFKHVPSELAELASMSMELISIDHWHLFFDKEADLQRAKKEQLTRIIEVLAWVATIDQFQHWIYEHPHHTLAQRQTAWNQIFDRFADQVTDWTGLEEYKNTLWQKQLHLFEVPFYYVEYGIAQLGALAVWKHYKEQPAQALKQYLEALKLGYTQPVPHVYAAAGIPFRFSSAHISELMQFAKSQLL